MYTILCTAVSKCNLASQPISAMRKSASPGAAGDDGKKPMAGKQRDGRRACSLTGQASFRQLECGDWNAEFADEYSDTRETRRRVWLWLLEKP